MLYPPGGLLRLIQDRPTRLGGLYVDVPRMASRWLESSTIQRVGGDDLREKVHLKGKINWADHLQFNKLMKKKLFLQHL